MGDGVNIPFIREDVLDKIAECRKKKEVPNFSSKVFEEAIDLSKQNLQHVIFSGASFPYREGETKVGANFTGADLKDADLQNAHIEYADFTGADLVRTKLEGAYIEAANFPKGNVRLGDADWGNYKIGEEVEAEKKKGEEQQKLLRIAEHRYRHLKQWYTDAGYYDTAGEFFYREMEAKRKRLGWLHPKAKRWLGWWPLRGEKVRLNIYRWLYGYGERPWRVVAWGMLVLFGLALLYFFLRGVAPYDLSEDAFLNSLYYSAVSFTALGYGPWFGDTSVHSWVKGVGAAEAIIGVFMIASFLVTFIRKMTR